MALARLAGVSGLIVCSNKSFGRSTLYNCLIRICCSAKRKSSGFAVGVTAVRYLHHFQIVLNEVQPEVIAPLLTKDEVEGSSVMTSTSSPSPVPNKSQHPSRMRKPSGVLSPPTRKGMFELDKDAFDKDIKVPTIYVYEDALNPSTLQKFKKFMLMKIPGLKPVIEAGVAGSGSSSASDETLDSPEDSSNVSARKIKKILLNPELLKGCDLTHFVQHEIQPDPSIVSSVGYEAIKFTYENWTLNQIMESILPDDEDKISGFSQVGHIVHVNLRDHLLPYKNIVGRVFLDKIHNAKTVVNKINIIESKYRNFQMELLAGDPQTVVTVKENRCEFEFDFATVYWNPRLSSEHDRLVKLIQPGEILYDVFAGVGPFAIPAGKRKITVLANDLNPDSFKWLQHNVKKNKSGSYVECFNQDGREFIQETIASNLKKHLTDSEEKIEEWRRFHVVMNLPALAVEFLDAFWGLLLNVVNDTHRLSRIQIIVHVYCFIKDIEQFKEKAVNLVNEHLGYDLPKENLLEVTFVRNVAPNKEMMRVTFRLPIEILIGSRKKLSKRKFCELDDVEVEDVI